MSNVLPSIHSFVLLHWLLEMSLIQALIYVHDPACLYFDTLGQRISRTNVKQILTKTHQKSNLLYLNISSNILRWQFQGGHQPLCCWLIWPIQNYAKNLKNDWNPDTWVLIRVLSESFLMSTKMAGFRWFSKIFKFTTLCFGQKYSLSIGRIKHEMVNACVHSYVNWTYFQPLHRCHPQFSWSPV